MSKDIPTAKQREAMDLYRRLMNELTNRVRSIEHAANGLTGMPKGFALEFCYLQVRMLCEILALGCLTAHGDIASTQTAKLQKEYSPDKILSRLEALHSKFYPCPVTQHRSSNPAVKMQMVDAEGDFLTKADVIKLYGRCGDVLHRGSVKRLLSPCKSKEVCKF